MKGIVSAPQCRLICFWTLLSYVWRPSECTFAWRLFAHELARPKEQKPFRNWRANARSIWRTSFSSLSHLWRLLSRGELFLSNPRATSPGRTKHKQIAAKCTLRRAPDVRQQGSETDEPTITRPRAPFLSLPISFLFLEKRKWNSNHWVETAAGRY